MKPVSLGARPKRLRGSTTFFEDWFMKDQFLQTLSALFLGKPYGFMIVVLALCLGGFALWDWGKKSRH
jgi:hypothetical protein